MSNSSVSICIEIPEEIHQAMKQYVEAHSDWNHDRVGAAALSLFLLQNGGSDSSNSYRKMARQYLDALFQENAA